jgi:hypothetical protein
MGKLPQPHHRVAILPFQPAKRALANLIPGSKLRLALGGSIAMEVGGLTCRPDLALSRRRQTQQLKVLSNVSHSRLRFRLHILGVLDEQGLDFAPDSGHKRSNHHAYAYTNQLAE